MLFQMFVRNLLDLALHYRVVNSWFTWNRWYIPSNSVGKWLFVTNCKECTHFVLFVVNSATIFVFRRINHPRKPSFVRDCVGHIIRHLQGLVGFAHNRDLLQGIVGICFFQRLQDGKFSYFQCFFGIVGDRTHLCGFVVFRVHSSCFQEVITDKMHLLQPNTLCKQLMTNRQLSRTCVRFTKSNTHDNSS